MRALWWASMVRGPWYFLVPAAVPGVPGLLMCGFGFGMVLLFAGAANSTMTSYRQRQTPDELMARVAALWSFATTVTQPLFILLGGLVATWAGTRVALYAAAAVMCAAALLLPRTSPSLGSIAAPGPAPGPGPGAAPRTPSHPGSSAAPGA
ncbi:hypothetical protein GCM10009733_100920 [Nonomuraea maheshkhaliensis]|uniref:MFS transporter n=1 Tax=Nonomuraea maheshkhaliensis TaxID=419590 RepID=A0ABN2HHN7_9ACTN